MPASPIDAIESIAPWSTKISSPQAGAAQVSSVDAEAFSRLLSGPKPESSPDASQNVGAIPPASNTLGDSILRSLQSMGGEFSNAWGNIVKATGPADGPMSMTDALNVQWHMVTVSAQYEAIGKAIGKSAQDIDQLVRTQ